MPPLYCPLFCSVPVFAAGKPKTIDEYRAAELDRRIGILIDKSDERPEIIVEYFVPDDDKEGGEYVTVKGYFKRVDDETKNILLEDGTVIPAEGLYNLESPIFDDVN